MKVVRARVYDMLREKEISMRNDARSAVMGTGNRSDRVRTYNFRDDRCTDHRTKVSAFGLKDLLGNGGMVDSFGKGLRDRHIDIVMDAVEEEQKDEGRANKEGVKQKSRKKK